MDDLQRETVAEILALRSSRLRREGQQSILRGESMIRMAERIEMLTRVLGEHRVFEDENLESALWALIEGEESPGRSG